MAGASPARALRLAVAGGPRLWADLARATAELVRARRRLARLDARATLRETPALGGPPPADPAPLVARVAYALPRAAARMPFRADCLVQAMAAQAWLAREGVGTALTVGVRQDPALGFQAHAWLRHGTGDGATLVTGGAVAARYVPLVAGGGGGQRS